LAGLHLNLCKPPPVVFFLSSTYPTTYHPPPLFHAPCTMYHTYIMYNVSRIYHPSYITSYAQQLESRRSVERIVEEFRRFKVRTEIQRKQKDAEARQAVINTTSGSAAAAAAAVAIDRTAGSSSSGSGGFQYSSNGELLGPAASVQVDELTRLKDTNKEQEAQWRASYERVQRENEVLRGKGGEALVATQWRGRYEACMREKEDLAEKLYSLTKYATVSAGGFATGAPTERRQEEEESGGVGMSASKIKYVRHMVFKYLCCTDPEVKVHIETALMTIFRMSDWEKQMVEAKRREFEESQDTLSSITSFLGSMGPS